MFYYVPVDPGNAATSSCNPPSGYTSQGASGLNYYKVTAFRSRDTAQGICEVK